MSPTPQPATPSFIRRGLGPIREVSRGVYLGPARALRHVNFRRFLSGQGISLIGTWMQSIALGWLVLELTHSAFAVGLTTTLSTLPILLLTLYGGVVADRVDKRRFIMLLQSVMLLEAAALAALTLTGHVTVHWVWGLAIVFGIATAFEVPARQAFLVELVPPDDLISAAAINSTTYNLARVIGPAIAGVVIAAAGTGAAFAFNALSYVAVLFALSRITKAYVPRIATDRPSVFTGLRFIKSRPTLAALSWQMVLLTIFAGSFVPMLSVYARNALHVGSRGYGALTAAVGLGAALGAIVMGGLGNRISRLRTSVVSSGTLAAATMSLAFIRSPWPALGALAVAGAAMAGQGISTATELQLAAPSELRGRVMAVYSFVVLGLAPIGAFQSGFVSEHFGVAWSFLFNAIVGMTGTVLLRRRLWTTQGA
ncbi:MAG: MFS transporter [Gemmatimonadota bacterium]